MDSHLSKIKITAVNKKIRYNQGHNAREFAVVFLSPPTQRVLARLKSPLSKQLWKRVSLLRDLKG